MSPANDHNGAAVHEPLMRSGATAVETADGMLELTRRLLPPASPVMDRVHQRYLQHFLKQDVVGHMESDLEGGVHAPDRGGRGARGGRRRRAVRPRRAADASRRRAGDQDDWRRGDDHRVGPRPVVEHSTARGLHFDRIADVRLKGSTESTEIFIAREREAA